MRVLPLPSFEAVLDGEVGEKEEFLTGLTVAEMFFAFRFSFFFKVVSPLTRERTPTYGYQSLSIQERVEASPRT